MTDRPFQLRILPSCDLFTEARMQSHVEWVGRGAGTIGWAKVVPDDWASCPNCITPWKCNGPHEPQSHR